MPPRHADGGRAPAIGTAPPHDRVEPQVRAPVSHVRPERDLVDAIRAELAAIEPTRACCRTAARAGLGAAASGHARTPAVARLAVRLEGAGDAAERSRAARGSRGGPTITPFEWDAARDHCRLSWLRGRFLAVGSLSLAEGRVHLEFVVPPAEVPILVARLDAVGLPVAWRLRRGRGVVTWKSTERVATFLRLVGASATMLELESRLVTRQMHGHLNRVINAETANLSRMVAASARQVEAIHALETSGVLVTLPATERAVAIARRDAPESSLSELAAQLGMSRSLVQRALDRLEAAAARTTDPPSAR